MGFHSFSLDPRSILGVGPSATAEEIHEAYRAKSKKHHPDMGGDEWAFRMVARAYEVLKATGRSTVDIPAEPSVTSTWAAEWTWAANHRFGATHAGGNDSGSGSAFDAQASSDDETDFIVEAETAAEPEALKSVDMELIWTRFEKDGLTRRPLVSDTDDSTLSVCLVIAWPPEDFVDQSAQFAGAAVTLRVLIDLFEQLRGQPSVVAARSRIEDGRFVGWLSYPDVIAAQDAVLKLRETFQPHGLTAKLRTRDERVPYDWRTDSSASVISRAS